MVVGGSRTIPEAQNFAKGACGALRIHHLQSFLGMNWVIIQKNSPDLGHFIFTSRDPRGRGVAALKGSWGILT